MSRTIPKLYDSSLSAASNEECEDYIVKKILKHPLLDDASALAKDNIELAPAGEIVSIIGPSGVGSTTLARSLKRYYAANWNVNADENLRPSMVHSLGVNAPCTNGRFGRQDWSLLLRSMLECGGDILADKKLYVPATEFQLQYSVPDVRFGRMDPSTLIRAVASMLDRRETNVVFINQAERLFPEKDEAARHLSQRLLGDLAAMTRTRFVLVSNYEILNANGVVDKFLKRKQIVHFRRYDWRFEGDLEAFNNVLVQLLGNVPGPLALRTLKAETARQTYISSIGCIGTVKNAVVMATKHAYKAQTPLTEELLLSCGQSCRVAAGCAMEAMAGERMLIDVTSAEVERILNGFGQAGVSTGGDANLGLSVPTSANGKQPAKVRKLGIGERRPTRDPVGGAHAKAA